jgi:hypothetical protein
MRVGSRLIAFLSSIFILSPGLFAQDNPNLQNGIVPFGSYDGGDFDSINLYNGNLALHIPLFNYPQRGTLPGQYQIVGNTKSFYVVQSCNPQLQTCTVRWQPAPTLGPQITQVSDTLGLQIPFRTSSPNGLHVVSWDGSSHQMIVTNAGTLESLDATGIWANNQFPPTTFLNKNGNGTPSSSGTAVEQDTNGNYFYYNSTNGSRTDTLGRSFTTSFPGPNGNPTQVQGTTANITVQTNFQAQTMDMYGDVLPIQELYPTSMPVVQSISVYNGSSWATSPTWTFQYNDRDPGRPIQHQLWQRNADNPSHRGYDLLYLRTVCRVLRYCSYPSQPWGHFAHRKRQRRNGFTHDHVRGRYRHRPARERHRTHVYSTWKLLIL